MATGPADPAASPPTNTLLFPRCCRILFALDVGSLYFMKQNGKVRGARGVKTDARSTAAGILKAARRHGALGVVRQPGRGLQLRHCSHARSRTLTVPVPGAQDADASRTADGACSRAAPACRPPSIYPWHDALAPTSVRSRWETATRWLRLCLRAARPPPGRPRLDGCGGEGGGGAGACRPLRRAPGLPRAAR